MGGFRQGFQGHAAETQPLLQGGRRGIVGQQVPVDQQQAPTHPAAAGRRNGMVAPGGTLVYCVCSLQPEEGEAQVDAFLARNPGFARRAVDAGEIGGLAQCVTPKGDLRTLPSHLVALGGLDGFHAARLQRRG